MLRNSAEAAKWFRKSAEQGHADAQSSLGGMYEDGKGVPRDYVQAHKWYNLAAAKDDTAKAAVNQSTSLPCARLRNLGQLRRARSRWQRRSFQTNVPTGPLDGGWSHRRRSE